MADAASNMAQNKAIEHAFGSLQVLAGPGSGKTYLTIRRIRHLIRNHGVSPEKILVITFTKAAACEMKDRFDLLTDSSFPQVRFGTFHSVFYHILQSSVSDKRSVAGSRERQGYLIHVLKSHQITDYDQELLEELLRLIGQKKCEEAGDITANEAKPCTEDDRLKGKFKDIYREYCGLLRENAKLDFDDMILECQKLLLNKAELCQYWQSAFSHILVDEFQDISPLQYEVIKILSKPEDNLFVVGDDDQSIYGFRGAGPDIMQHFLKDFPGALQVRLNINYRCTEQIVNMAKAVIVKNENRFPKDIRADKQGGDQVSFLSFKTKDEEKNYIAGFLNKLDLEELINTAIIFRTNAEVREMERFLRKHSVMLNSRQKAESLTEHPIFLDFAAYLRFAQQLALCGRGKREDFLRIMNKPQRYISREALAGEFVDRQQLTAFYNNKPYMQKTLDRLFEELFKVYKMRPFAAMNFIRKAIGYDAYLKQDKNSKSREEDILIIDQLQSFAAKAASWEEWRENILDNGNKNEGEKRSMGVNLLTMHASKGLEYENVFLPDLNEGTVPYHKADSKQRVEEERRLFYVAMTRAKKRLSLCYLEESEENHKKPSRFIRHLI